MRAKRVDVISFGVDSYSFSEAADAVLDAARNGVSGYVCVANVHMVMEAYDDPSFRDCVLAADFVVPDGMPLVWVMKALGCLKQERVRGPELMPELCKLAEREGLSVGFLGGRDEVLREIQARLALDFPKLRVAYCYSPPFRKLSDAEELDIDVAIKNSGAQILFVGLGCPKQERWMAAHAGRFHAVMLGVGAAFDMYAGKIRECPLWLQKLGLEWLYRLKEEPRRLWRRYAVHNPRFIYFAILQIARRRIFSE